MLSLGALAACNAKETAAAPAAEVNNPDKNFGLQIYTLGNELYAGNLADNFKRLNGMGFKSDEEVVEVGVEVGKCSDGYFAQLVDVNIMFFHYIEPTLDELGKRLTWEREFWEEFYDYVVKIKYTPESTLARGFVEEL